MMTISDIVQIILFCALIFFPLGYLARHSLRRISDTTRLLFAKPRYVNQPELCAALRSQGRQK